MASGGHTTVIRRVLERRAAKPATVEEGTTATVAVMLRVLPPPKALLVFQDAPLREQMQRRITPDVLECESVADDDEALRRFAAEFRPVVLTDSLELVRKLRAQRTAAVAVIVFVAEVGDAPARAPGMLVAAYLWFG